MTLEERRERNRNYMREYRKTHPEKIKEYAARYQQSHKDKLREYMKAYRKTHPEYVEWQRAYQREWYHRDKTKGWGYGKASHG